MYTCNTIINIFENSAINANNSEVVGRSPPWLKSSMMELFREILMKMKSILLFGE